MTGTASRGAFRPGVSRGVAWLRAGRGGLFLLAKSTHEIHNNLEGVEEKERSSRAAGFAGVLIQIPHQFFARESARLGFELPPAGEYGVGMMFLPVEPQPRLR